MRPSSFRFVGLVMLIAAGGALAAGDKEQDKEQAIKKDQKLYEGTWRIVSLEINGNKASDDDVKKLTVVNGPDGAWTLLVDGAENGKGTSQIDPTQKIKSIDITPTDGDSKDKKFLGIYEIDENTRKLCLAAAGKDRPADFSANAGSERILATFERVKPK